MSEQLSGVNRRFDEGNQRIARLESQFEAFNQSFVELNRVFIKFSYAIIGTIFAGFMAVLATTL